MKRSIFKPIVIGILIGAAAFFAPFLMLKVFFFMLIVGLIFKLFWLSSGGWRGGGNWGRHRGKMSYGVLFADKIRNMSEEEFAEFKNNYANNSCGSRCGCGCGSYGCCGDCDPKEKSEEKAK